MGRTNTEKEKEILDGTTFSTSLTSLESYVTYEIEILAYTRIGPGPRSSAVRATTLESGKVSTSHGNNVTVFFSVLNSPDNLLMNRTLRFFAFDYCFLLCLIN